MPTTKPQRLRPIAILERPAIGWPGGPHIHHMILTHENLVVHKTPMGLHIEPLRSATRGLPTRVQKRVPVVERSAAEFRLRVALKEKRKYQVVDENCQHLASFVATGKKRSTTIENLVSLCALTSVTFLMLAVGTNRRSR